MLLLVMTIYTVTCSYAENEKDYLNFLNRIGWIRWTSPYHDIDLECRQIG